MQEYKNQTTLDFDTINTQFQFRRDHHFSSKCLLYFTQEFCIVWLIIKIYRFCHCEFFFLKFICNPKSFLAMHGHVHSQMRSNKAGLPRLILDLTSTYKIYLVPHIFVSYVWVCSFANQNGHKV